ncbi:MAG TPA: alpha-ketoglutarate-dependent dioxygenase AlkB [Acidimicrobiales bacterium]|nr:alpha-ketoglutarate-dependent dioxygenase AlkB [Acidimicrobiales bacterium]
MSSGAELAWQGSLLDGDEPAADATFGGLTRHQIDATAWVDHLAGWLSGADVVFEQLLAAADWQAHTRVMYGNVVDQPRLTASWRKPARIRAAVPVIEEIRALLSERYGVVFDTGGLNLYRDGRDSVAWHRDRIPKAIEDPLVAIVSVGHARTFLARPRGGGRSTRFALGHGDLLVTGGTFQRTWEHAVPKVASAAGPRISITFRHSA